MSLTELKQQLDKAIRAQQYWFKEVDRLSGLVDELEHKEAAQEAVELMLGGC